MSRRISRTCLCKQTRTHTYTCMYVNTYEERNIERRKKKITKQADRHQEDRQTWTDRHREKENISPVARM